MGHPVHAALRVAKMTALGRAGEPDDIGPMVSLLLSQD